MPSSLQSTRSHLLQSSPLEKVHPKTPTTLMSKPNRGRHSFWGLFMGACQLVKRRDDPKSKAELGHCSWGSWGLPRYVGTVADMGIICTVHKRIAVLLWHAYSWRREHPREGFLENVESLKGKEKGKEREERGRETEVDG